ncbi:MAG: hypothetical protein HPY90_05775 [Syntrophothermus sp.]|uniref:hypothetical protein n=1 Tax=Syntrophothermus sp. TaxID=2736299 RepID=UPI00257A668B|nr:hypothetical protein [Syntrophothermus sp.]NSW82774.1 hypothetical protein [Syntrophothermus sp.]
MLPAELLRKYSQSFPKAWKIIEDMRRGRGKELPFWPDWCYCPIAGALAIVTEGSSGIGCQEFIKMQEYPPAVLTALAAWRRTKGVYRFVPFRRVTL